MLAARGIDVSHETVRRWAEKFGRDYANRLRRRAIRPGDTWHLDEVVITIAGEKHWLWRAVDGHGFVLDVLVQKRRDTKAAKRLMRKLLKKYAMAPRVMITDKLRSYAAAKRDLRCGAEHRQHKGLNNRAENSHQPTRRRERIMKRFKTARHVGGAWESLQDCTLSEAEACCVKAVRAQRPEAFAWSLNFGPEIVTGERDVIPFDGRHVR